MTLGQIFNKQDRVSAARQACVGSVSDNLIYRQVMNRCVPQNVITMRLQITTLGIESNSYVTML